MKTHQVWLLSFILSLVSASTFGAEPKQPEPLSAAKLDALYERYCEWAGQGEIGAPRTTYYAEFRAQIRAAGDLNLKRAYVLACLAGELDSRIADFVANRHPFPQEATRSLTKSEREKSRVELSAMLDDLAMLDPADSAGAIARYRPLVSSPDKGN